ncbi:MAG: DNA replication and repair protein RecF, partial [Myxococcales bacterium]|nr:DNA replication and repair protein RecF [Myxococcales bacterium]
MIVTRVETHDFRNLQAVALDPHARFTVLCGDNAQGKTNLLEAVYLLGMRRSFRATRTSEMIRFGAEAATVRGRANVGALMRDVEVQLKADGRRVLVDGKGVRASSPKLEGLAAVLFTPDDLAVPRGSPSGRRQLLDTAIATVWPGYQQLGRDYQKTLATRNRLLREQPSGFAELLDVYDTQLAQLGAKIVAARRRYLAQLLPRFEDAFARIAHSGVRGTLSYRTDEALV